jgi:hypothetical protein
MTIEVHGAILFSPLHHTRGRVGRQLVKRVAPALAMFDEQRHGDTGASRSLATLPDTVERSPSNRFIYGQVVASSDTKWLLAVPA